MSTNIENFNEKADKSIKIIEKEFFNNLNIKFNKIKPFANNCKVDNTYEYCNVEVEYIPRDKILDIVSHREFFEKNRFNMYIEEIADSYYDYLINVLKPIRLKVIVSLEDPKLTNWSAECSNFVESK